MSVCARIRVYVYDVIPCGFAVVTGQRNVFQIIPASADNASPRLFFTTRADPLRPLKNGIYDDEGVLRTASVDRPKRKVPAPLFFGWCSIKIPNTNVP
jgi:hypothetical protein